jgi:PAS domain-containing protein
LFDGIFSLRDVKDATHYTFERILSTLQLGGDIIEREFSAALSDGRVLDLFINASVLTSHDARLLGCTISLHDVTGLKRAEEKLRESRAELAP